MLVTVGQLLPRCWDDRGSYIGRMALVELDGSAPNCRFGLDGPRVFQNAMAEIFQGYQHLIYAANGTRDDG